MIKGIILGLFEMYTLCISVCVCTMYLYFLLALKKRDTVQLQILAHLGWMQPRCQDEVQPVTDHFMLHEVMRTPPLSEAHFFS